MAKQGRPGIQYEKFVETWERLLSENRAGNNAAHDILGGSKSTIAVFRDRYEQEKTSKELSIIKGIELTEAIRQAIAGIKVKEIEVLEENNLKLQKRTDDYLKSMKDSEDQFLLEKNGFNEAKEIFKTEQLKLERKLAAANARIEDMEKRDQELQIKYEKLNDQYNQAKQESAVAKKEVEMLREQSKK